MRSFRSTTILFLCALLLGSCTSVSVSRDAKEVRPVTYRARDDVRIERSVGKLRRLAVLPVQLDVSPKNPKLCLEKCGWEGLDSAIEMEAIRCLRGKRGYEVVSMDSLAGEGGKPFTTEELAKFTQSLAHQARESDPDLPSEGIISLVKELGGRAELDGIVVIQGESVSLNIIDFIALYATFTLSSPITFLRIGVSLRADVFEVATGRTVWTSSLTSGGHPNASEGYGTMLLDPIEPALPRLFTIPLDKRDKVTDEYFRQGTLSKSGKSR